MARERDEPRAHPSGVRPRLSSRAARRPGISGGSGGLRRSIGTPPLSAAATTSSSRTEPPGWTTATIPASRAASTRREGEKRRSRAPPSGVAGLVRGDADRVDAAHLSRSDAGDHLLAGQDDHVRLDVLGDAVREGQLLELLRRQRRLGDLLELGLADPVTILDEEAWTSASPWWRCSWESGPKGPQDRARLPQRGLRVSSSNASSSNSGADRLDEAVALEDVALARSRGRVNASTDPKALIGSPDQAFSSASEIVAATAAPHGLVCLMTATKDSENSDASRPRPGRRGCCRRAPCRSAPPRARRRARGTARCGRGGRLVRSPCRRSARCARAATLRAPASPSSWSTRGSRGDRRVNRTQCAGEAHCARRRGARGRPPRLSGSSGYWSGSGDPGHRGSFAAEGSSTGRRWRSVGALVWLAPPWRGRLEGMRLTDEVDGRVATLVRPARGRRRARRGCRRPGSRRVLRRTGRPSLGGPVGRSPRRPRARRLGTRCPPWGGSTPWSRS